MGYQEQYAANAADIYLKSAQQRANARRQRGVLLGNTLQALGQLPMEYQQQQEHQQDRAAKQQQQTTDNELRQAELDIRKQQLAQKDDPAVGQLNALKLREMKVNSARSYFDGLDEHTYPDVVPELRRIFGPGSEAEIPDQYPGDAWRDRHAKEGTITAESLAADRRAAQKAIEDAKPKPPKVVQITTRDAQGNPVTKFVEEKVGDEYQQAPPKPASQPNVGSFEDYVIRKYGDNPTPAQITEGRKVYNQADDRPRVNVSVNGPGGVGNLDAGGLELAATEYRLTHRLPARNAGQNGAIISAAAKQAKELGNSPVQTIQKQAAYAGDSKALAKMQSMSAAAESFENKAVAQADIIADLSNKVGRTQFPLLNSAILAGKSELLGDKDTQLLYNAISTFTAEYAKIMEGSTGSAAGSSDAARTAAGRLISAKLNKGTLQGTLDLMKREMSLTIQGYDATINHITDRMGGSTPAAPATPPAPTSGFDVPAPNGKTYHFKTRGDAEAFKARAGIK